MAGLYLAAVVVWHVICLLDFKPLGRKEASNVSAQLFSVFVRSAESVLIREAFQSFPKIPCEMPRQREEVQLGLDFLTRIRLCS